MPCWFTLAAGPLNCFFGEKREGWKGPRIHVHVERETQEGLQSVQFSKPSRLGSAYQANHAREHLNSHGVLWDRRNSGKNKTRMNAAHTGASCTAGPVVQAKAKNGSIAMTALDSLTEQHPQDPCSSINDP